MVEEPLEVLFVMVVGLAVGLAVAFHVLERNE
jgi:hypothetical protein